MNNDSLILNHLSTGYRIKSNDKIISRDLNTEILPGSFVALMGANGGGKSTLLRTLAAYQPPISGEIYYGSRKLSSLSAEEIAKLISVVLTEKPQISNTTVEELVSMGRQPYTGFWGKLSERDKIIVRDCISDVGIINLADRNVNTLSDGEFQKVMIAKALAQQTPIIYLDEPTAFLDFPSKIEINRLLSGLAHERRCIIIQSTHDLELALRIADKIWLVDHRIGSDYGTMEQLAAANAFDRYFGSYDIKFNNNTLRFEW